MTAQPQYWNVDQPGSVLADVKLKPGDRIYSMDAAGDYLVAATSNRQIYVFHRNDPANPCKVGVSFVVWRNRL